MQDNIFGFGKTKNNDDNLTQKFVEKKDMGSLLNIDKKETDTTSNQFVSKDIVIENKSLEKEKKKIDVDKLKGKVTSVITRLKRVKHIEFYIAGVAIALMLLIYFSGTIFSSSSSTKDNTSSTQTYDNYIAQTENKVAEMVRQMRGVGKADVAIHFESSIEYVIAVITSETSSGKTETPILITENGVTKPIIIKEIYPKAKGVVVVCEGGGDNKVKNNIIEAVAVMLDIVRDKIVVTPM